jgi:O-antigen/teichoic acid export membrane protein
MQLYGGAFTALGRIALSFRMTTAKAVVELASSVGLVLAGAGAVGAAFGRGAGFIAGGVFGFFALRRLFGRRGPEEAASPVALRHIAAYAGALFLIEGAFVLFEQIDVLLIGAIIGASAVGLFQAALRMVTFLQYPAQALAAGVAPRVARHEVSGSEVEPLARSLRLLVLFQMALIPPILVWADPLVNLVLGSEYAESAEVLRALAPFVLLAGVGPLLSMAVNYLGEARRRLPIAVGAVALNAAIDAVLIPRIGIVAGAIGTDVAYAVYVPAHLWLVKRMLDIPLRPLAVSFARALVAGAAMAGVLALFGTQEVAFLLLVAGGALATVVYAGVLLVTREVSAAELAELWGSARAGLLPSRP